MVRHPSKWRKQKLAIEKRKQHQRRRRRSSGETKKEAKSEMTAKPSSGVMAKSESSYRNWHEISGENIGNQQSGNGV